MNISSCIVMPHLTKWEKETIINFNQESKEAEIYTRDENVIRRMDALCELYPDYYRCTKRTSVDCEYVCPKRLIGIKKPVILSEARREQAQEWGRKLQQMRMEKQAKEAEEE